MKVIDFSHAKHVAMTTLAMTSCGFALWLSQVNGQADVTAPDQTATVTESTDAVQQGMQASATTTAVVAANTDQATSNVNQNDQGNYANMDSQAVNDQGQLIARGWHATNGSATRPYHYIIAYDQTNHREIGRQNITDQVISRPDVQQQHNVAGAGKSGFAVQFDLSKILPTTNSVQLISRYTADKQGNGDSVDYWFAPLTINHNNYGNLDSATVKDNKLVLSGWHATNQAANKANHYIIILDRTTGKEVGRQLVKAVSRPDVAKVYPGVDKAGQSGFTTAFAMDNLNFNDQLQVLSRYTSSADGNSDFVDYYFAPITNGNFSNQGSLDSWDLTSGRVVVTGWHANDVSQFEDNHFLILFDNTTNSQVAVTNAKRVTREDVAKAFPNVKTAKNSGFTGSFSLQNSLVGGHSYSIVSRYSTSNKGNGGDGKYVDFWSAPKVLNRHHYYIDSQKMTQQGLQVGGWMISDYSGSDSHPYIIVLNDNHEITRQQLTLNDRPDVAKVYSGIYNSKKSGFTTLVKLNPADITGNMHIVLRFSSDASNGEGNKDDQWTPAYASNQGSFDQVTVNGSNIYVSGWHASNGSASRPYQWLIFLDQNGHELTRHQVQDVNRARPDVGNAVGYILNSDHSGFQLAFALPDNLQHKVVRIIDRLTDDVNGNGNSVDYYSGNVSINSGAQTSGLKTLYYDAMGNIVGAFNNAEVICQLPELPTGCEITAVTMMLRYAGYNVNKIQLANEMPRSSNGDFGFVGNPFSPSGWWVFPTGVAPVVNHYVGHSQVMTGTSLQAIQEKLREGHLVVVWMANMNGFVNHAITLTGYNANGFDYNNPWTGRKEAMSYGEFYSHWNADRQRALSY